MEKCGGNMLSQEMLAARLLCVTGSDAAVICGLSPYKTPYQLWEEKTGRKVQEDISDKNYIKFGNYFEDGVAAWFEADSGKKLKLKASKMLTHSSVDYIAGNVDFEIDGENAILECKTALSDEGWGNAENIIPPYYLMQVAHYCAVGNYDKAYIAVVFAQKREMRWYEYERNLELEEKLLAREKAFWESVQNDIAPEPINVDDLMQMYKAADTTPIVATGEISTKLDLLKDVNNKLKMLELQKETLRKEIALYMQAHDTLVDAKGSVIATWKFTKVPQRFDSKAFESENKELYKKYVRDGYSQRRFLIKGVKDE